jgi:transposase-like protein
MHKLTETDEKFLFPILKSKEHALKAEALVLLMRDQRMKRPALETLFRLPSVYGIKNNRLIEHIKIIEDKDLKEAKPYLEEFSKRRGFWNKKLRKESLRILEKWNAEQN